MSVLSLLLVLTASAGCGPSALPRSQPGTAEPGSEESDREPPVELAELGFELAPEAVPGRAVTTRETAAAAYAAGELERARVGFTNAVAVAPHYDEARFDLARTLARMERHDEAARELDRLLARDLPSFGPRLRLEPDLDRFRRSGAGRRTLARLESIQRAWEAAAADGVPALLLRGGPSPAPAPGERAAPELLRPGLYVHRHRRLLPAAPPVPFAAAALLDPRAGRTVVIAAGRYDEPQGGYEDAEPWETGKELHVFPFPYRGGAAMTRRFGERLAALSVEPIERGARFRRAVVSGGQDRWDVGLERFELLTGGGARPDPDQSPFAGAVLVSSAAESWLEPAAPPTPLRLEGASLVGAERQVELAGPHPLGGRTLLLLAPAGDRALALTEVEPCDGRGAEARVVADLVELARAASTRLVDGPGRAMGTFGPDGSLYLQLDEPAGRSSVAVHPVGETGPEDVPPGVLLRAPRPVVADCDR